MEFRTILAIGVHPDDIEFGCYGNLYKQREKAEIHLFVASAGSKGDATSGDARIEESRQAFKHLNPKTLTQRKELGLQSGDFETVLASLTDLLDRINPDLIFTPGPHETHQEHRLMYEITLAAARRSKASILCYGIVSNTLEFKPAIFVDITAEYEEKKRALHCHKTQIEKIYMGNDYLGAFHTDAYALLQGIKYCERFEIVRIFS